MSDPTTTPAPASDPRPTVRGGGQVEGEGPIPTDQASEDPRGDDDLRRELGPGDGDDAPPVTGDEPSPR